MLSKTALQNNASSSSLALNQVPQISLQLLTVCDTEVREDARGRVNGRGLSPVGKPPLTFALCCVRLVFALLFLLRPPCYVHVSDLSANV